jgi:outer membrane biosynthesis protein TonB
MKDYRLLQGALLISFCVHTVTIFGSQLLLYSKIPENDRQIKVTYLKIEKTPKDRLKPKENSPLKRIPPPFIEPQDIRKESSVEKPRDVKFTKPELINPEEIAVKKKITLPAVDMLKTDNPSYISYYQIVREKIRRAAYRSYVRSETGEVYATFIISSDGILKNAQLIDEKSSAGPYLKGIALSSIKAASPFPNFPKELDFEELSFNVAISFEAE